MLFLCFAVMDARHIEVELRHNCGRLAAPPIKPSGKSRNPASTMTHFSENERENRRENVVQAMAADEPNNNEQDNPKSESRGKFRFKSKKRSASIDEDDGRRSHRSRRKKDERSSRRSSKRRSHRSRAHKESAPPNASNDDPSAYDDTYDAGTRSGEYMDPNSAFIESLFDALADDEGAAYWEDVYGQPIHTYPNVKEGPGGRA